MSPQSEIKLWEPQDIMDKKVWASESLMVQTAFVYVSSPTKSFAPPIAPLMSWTSRHGLHSHKHHILTGLSGRLSLAKTMMLILSAHLATGKIIVSTGLLDHFKTDAEIAFSIAHEVGLISEFTIYEIFSA
jgi:Zn-dependent protease with chaperone function